MYVEELRMVRCRDDDAIEIYTFSPSNEELFKMVVCEKDKSAFYNYLKNHNHLSGFGECDFVYTYGSYGKDQQNAILISLSSDFEHIGSEMDCIKYLRELLSFEVEEA